MFDGYHMQTSSSLDKTQCSHKLPRTNPAPRLFLFIRSFFFSFFSSHTAAVQRRFRVSLSLSFFYSGLSSGDVFYVMSQSPVVICLCLFVFCFQTSPLCQRGLPRAWKSRSFQRKKNDKKETLQLIAMHLTENRRRFPHADVRPVESTLERHDNNNEKSWIIISHFHLQPFFGFHPVNSFYQTWGASCIYFLQRSLLLCCLTIINNLVNQGFFKTFFHLSKKKEKKVYCILMTFLHA